MEIQFVGHASFSISACGKRLLCDPWLSGKVFNDGWAHISPPIEVAWSKIDYLWISHEHPDHFHFPTLKAIPAEDKKRITVLYQRHASKRIVEALKKLGFATVIELPLFQWMNIEPGLEIYCGSAGVIDSFLAIRSEGKCILNLNDCVLDENQLHHIKSDVGHVDVLFTQFSFANWVGNDADETGGALEKRGEIKQQASLLKPEYLVPFASYIYFCNEENQRMNAWVNTPQEIQNMRIPQLHFMYPGDVWNLQRNEPMSLHAIARFTEDFNRTKLIDPTPASVGSEKLLNAATSCMESLVERFGYKIKKVPMLRIYIKDLDKVLVFTPAARSVSLEDPGREIDCHMEMCSQVAWYTFNFSWGGGTLSVSGMFRAPLWVVENEHPFFRLQRRMSSQYLEFGNLSQSFRTIRFLWEKKREIYHYWSARLYPAKRNKGNSGRRYSRA